MDWVQSLLMNLFLVLMMSNSYYLPLEASENIPVPETLWPVLACEVSLLPGQEPQFQRQRGNPQISF